MKSALLKYLTFSRHFVRIPEEKLFVFEESQLLKKNCGLFARRLYKTRQCSLVIAANFADVFTLLVLCKPIHNQMPEIFISILIDTAIQSFCGQRSVVGIVTSYGLDGPGIESRWRRDFPHLSKPALRPTQPPVPWVPGLSRG